MKKTQLGKVHNNPTGHIFTFLHDKKYFGRKFLPMVSEYTGLSNILIERSPQSETSHEHFNNLFSATSYPLHKNG